MLHLTVNLSNIILVAYAFFSLLDNMNVLVHGCLWFRFNKKRAVMEKSEKNSFKWYLDLIFCLLLLCFFSSTFIFFSVTFSRIDPEDFEEYFRSYTRTIIFLFKLSFFLFLPVSRFLRFHVWIFLKKYHR